LVEEPVEGTPLSGNMKQITMPVESISLKGGLGKKFVRLFKRDGSFSAHPV
jgi:hypothetical protein